MKRSQSDLPTESPKSFKCPRGPDWINDEGSVPGGGDGFARRAHPSGVARWATFGSRLLRFAGCFYR